jgi:hypothetical protein
MGETKHTQKQTKAELDDKLKLASPSRQILEDLAIGKCASMITDKQLAFLLFYVSPFTVLLS